MASVKSQFFGNFRLIPKVFQVQLHRLPTHATSTRSACGEAFGTCLMTGA